MNEDEQLRYETETAQAELGHAIHGVGSALELLASAVAKHRRYVGGAEIRFIWEAKIALDEIAEHLEMKAAAE